MSCVISISHASRIWASVRFLRIRSRIRCDPPSGASEIVLWPLAIRASSMSGSIRSIRRDETDTLAPLSTIYRQSRPNTGIIGYSRPNQSHLAAMGKTLVDQRNDVIEGLLAKRTIDKPRTAETTSARTAPADFNQEHVSELGVKQSGSVKRRVHAVPDRPGRA